MESFGTKDGIPKKNIKIADCGEYENKVEKEVNSNKRERDDDKIDEKEGKKMKLDSKDEKKN